MSADWWNRKMANRESPRVEPLPPTPIAQPRALAQPQYQHPQQQVAPRTGPPVRAGRCPECDSGNWMRPTSSVAARCFDCGHVEGRDFDLSAQGTISKQGPATATKQVPSGGFNPHQIIGRVD